MGSNLFTGGGGKGAGCVLIRLMILEAAKNENKKVNRLNIQLRNKH